MLITYLGRARLPVAVVDLRFKPLRDLREDSPPPVGDEEVRRGVHTYK